MDVAIAEKLLEQAPDALLLTDAHGRILFSNAAITQLFGYTAEQLLGETIEVLLPERYRDAHLQHRCGYVAQPTQRGMGRRGVSLLGRRKDASEFPIWVSLSPIQIDGCLQIVAAVRDVTDWDDITRQLRDASEEAKQANQIKSRFLATASHDLRQPLQALQLLTTSLERKLIGNAAMDLVTRQQHAIDAMTELLNSLLDISKLESGTVQVTHEAVDPAQMFSEVREQFESAAAAKNLKLRSEVAEVTLYTDRVLLRQLLQNLVGNAVKYTEFGQVSLKLLHSPMATVIEVTDTGVGISRDQLPKIFDAYYQLHSVSSHHSGVGLGLAIVKEIAELLGYDIGVESQPGMGTTFRISIPPQQVSGAQIDAVSVPKVVDAVLQDRCILIIEDDRAVREAIALALDLEGFMTLSAGDEFSARQLYAQHGENIAAVVSDYHVDARRNGIDIVTSLRTAHPRRLPAVLLTGDTSMALRTRQELPDSRLLNKPVDIHCLVQSLTELLR